jgi:hypothetical protein
LNDSETTKEAGSRNPQAQAFGQEQYAARELGTDESKEVFERAFRKVVLPKQS